MSEDECPDSDSSGRTFRRSTGIRSRRAKEAWICSSSRTTMSLQDPMPEHVDPELVKLIAQNAPFELDVLVRSLQNKNGPKRRAEHYDVRKGEVLKAGERRPPPPVETLLSPKRGRNDHLSTCNKPGQDVRHSCPERMFRDYDEKDEEFFLKAKAVKRKRPKGLDGYRLPPADGPNQIEGRLGMNDSKARSKSRASSPKDHVAPGHSSYESSKLLAEERLARFNPVVPGVSLTVVPQSIANDGDVLKLKPWRHGMRKGMHSAAKDEKPPPMSSKAKAEIADSWKTSEVRKYMKTKILERRKEQQQLKAEAGAALISREEQQRKLDMHRQAIFQSQLAGGRSREHAQRPAWVSEYSSRCEPPQPWSSSSSERNTYLPAPMTPPKLVPLDLFATQVQYAEGHPSILRKDGTQLQIARPRGKRRSKKAKGCSREVQRQLKFRKSRIMEEFPPLDVELNAAANSPLTEKARWKAKTKPRGRKSFSEDCFQLQLVGQNEENFLCQQRSEESKVYKRTWQRQNNSPRVCKPSRTQTPTSRVSSKTPTKSKRLPESCVQNMVTDPARSLSKVKRLKPTERYVPRKTKDFTGEELATLLNARRIPSDREVSVGINPQVITERMMIVRTSLASPAASEQGRITDLLTSGGHSLGSPLKKNTPDKDHIGLGLFGPSLECSENDVIVEDTWQQGNRDRMPDTKLSRSKDLQLQQVRDSEKEKLQDSEILRSTTRKQTNLGVRWQRMQLLKNLAEQLVKRVNAACAKKRQIELLAVKQSNSPSGDIDTLHSEVLTQAESGLEVDSPDPKREVDNQLTIADGLSSTHLVEYVCHEKKSQDSELKFFHHHEPERNNFLHCTGLSEQEQAGCESPNVHHIGRELKIGEIATTSNKKASMSEASDQNKPAGGLDNDETCTMMDWDTSDKVVHITRNDPATLHSGGPSSLSTGSSSPVVLPTSSKHHLRRFKNAQKNLNHERRRCPSKKSEWAVPVENDTYSIFKVYSEQLKEREKLAIGIFPHVDKNDFAEMESDPGIAEPATHEDMSNIASIPLYRKPSRPVVFVKPLEPISIQTVRSTDGTYEKKVSQSVVGTGPNLQMNQHLSSSRFDCLRNMAAGADKDAIRPSAEVNTLKTDPVELAGNIPEVTILEIGDMKLCQSPTSFHLRLDRCKDNPESTRSKQQKVVDVSLMPEETRGRSGSSVIPPMKVTYARRVHSRAMIDGGCTDERVVVELHQRWRDIPAVQLQGDTRLGNPDLDVSDESPQGLTSSRSSKGFGNAQSEDQEERTVKLSTVNEDFKKGYASGENKGNVQLQPTVDHVSDHSNFVSDVRKIESSSEMVTGPEGELVTRPDHCPKPDPKLDLREFEEWDLKFRRDQLEAELQRLDDEIMKTRARLHQRHSGIDSQVHTFSSSPAAKQPIEWSLKVDKASRSQDLSAKDLTSKERHDVVFELSSDLQLQSVSGFSHSNPKSRRDEKKNVTCSNSCSDSSVSEDIEMGQKPVLGAGTCDSFAGHPFRGKTINAYGKFFRDSKTCSEHLEGALEDRSLPCRSHALKKRLETHSFSETPAMQGNFPSEGSAMSTGRGPRRSLDMPPAQSAATRDRKVLKARSLSPDYMITCRKVHPSGKDEANMHEVGTTSDDESRKGSRTSLDSIPQEIQENFGRGKRQTSSQPNTKILGERRNSHARPDCGPTESQSSLFQSGSPHTESKNNSMTGRTRNCKLASTTGVDTSNGNGTSSACIQQNEWLMDEKQRSTVVRCDEVEEVRASPNGSEYQERKTCSTGISSRRLLLSPPWTTSENGSGVPRSELLRESQMIGEVMVGKKLPGGCQNAKTLVSAEDSFILMAASEELPCQLSHSVGTSDDYNLTVVPRDHGALPQTSPCPIENSGQFFSLSSTWCASNFMGQMKVMPNGGTVSTSADEERQIDDEAAATVLLQSAPAVPFGPVRSKPCTSTTIEKVDWECLGLPSHMDFSTIKEKLRNNKLADDNLGPVFNGWSSYQSKSLRSPSISEEAAVDFSGVQTVAREGIVSSDVSHIIEDLQHENLKNAEIKQSAKSTCPPREPCANKENVLRVLPSCSKSALNIKYSDTQGLITPGVSSRGEVSNFLSSPYFPQETMKSSIPSEELESTVSEDLENYESDVDDAVSSGSNLETTSARTASLPPSSSESEPIIACCVGIRSSNVNTFHSDSGFPSVANELTLGTGEVSRSRTLIHNALDKDLPLVSLPTHCASVCGMGGQPTEAFPRQFDNSLSFLRAGGQCTTQAPSCASYGDADGEVIRDLHILKSAVNVDDSNSLKITRSHDSYGFEVSDGSHFQSESISEEVCSVETEVTHSSRSGPKKQNDIYPDDLVDSIVREQSNNSVDATQQITNEDAGTSYACHAVVSSNASPGISNFIEDADGQHFSVGAASVTSPTGISVKDSSDINSSSLDCATITVNFQEVARISDQHVFPLGSDILTFASSKPIAFALSFKYPPLRTSEDSIQHNCGTHLSSVSSLGKVSYGHRYQVEEPVLEDVKHLLEDISRMKLQSTSKKQLLTESPSIASPCVSDTSPEEIMKAADTLHLEPSDPGIVCNLDVARDESSPVLLVQKSSEDSKDQMRSIKDDAASLADDGDVYKRDFYREHCVAEELEETEQLSDETSNLSHNFTADFSSDNENAKINIPGEEDHESVVAVPSDSIYKYSGPGLQKVPYQDTKGVVGPMPLDLTSSKSDPTLVTGNKIHSVCSDLPSGTSESQQFPVEYGVDHDKSKRSFNSFRDDQGEPATSTHEVVPADGDLQTSKDNCRFPKISLRSDQIIALQAGHANKLRDTSPLLKSKQVVIDLGKHAAENQAHEKSYNQQVNFGFDFTSTNAENEDAQLNFPVCSLVEHPKQTHLPPAQDALVMSESPTNCGCGSSSKRGFLSCTLHSRSPRDRSLEEGQKLPVAEDPECSSDVCCSNGLLRTSAQTIVGMEENGELGRRATSVDDVGCLGSEHVTGEEQMISRSPGDVSYCFQSNSESPPSPLDELKQKMKIEMDAGRAVKHNIITDLLTSMIYEDLLCVELSGFQQEVERTISINKMAVVSKGYNLKVKRRSRKVSEFCHVLKHFLPVGWRSASIRHKTGLFLQVEGLRPHPLDPATRAMPRTGKCSVQHPFYVQSFSKTATQFLLLDSSDVHSHVQRSLEASGLILDPSRANWYESEKPAVEHVFSDLGTQNWEASRTFEHSNWEIHEKLISDLIDEIVLKQFVAKWLVPCLGITPPPAMPAGGEDLVQFVTNGIVEHERYPSKHGFEIEKVIAKAIEDEHWERCSEEARDVVGDLAQDILGDLIERLVFEMIRGCCYYINHSHVLRT